jgi:chaperonin GroES
MKLDYTQLQLSHNKLLVRPLAGSDMTEGGIVKPESTREQLRGIVVAKGPGALNERGDRIAVDTPIGALVFFGRYAGLDLEDGSGYLILSDVEATCWLTTDQFTEVVHEDFRKNHLDGDGCELCRERDQDSTRQFLQQQREELGLVEKL